MSLWQQISQFIRQFFGDTFDAVTTSNFGFATESALVSCPTLVLVLVNGKCTHGSSTHYFVLTFKGYYFASSRSKRRFCSTFFHTSHHDHDGWSCCCCCQKRGTKGIDNLARKFGKHKRCVPPAIIVWRIPAPICNTESSEICSRQVSFSSRVSTRIRTNNTQLWWGFSRGVSSCFRRKSWREFSRPFPMNGITTWISSQWSLFRSIIIVGFSTTRS